MRDGRDVVRVWGGGDAVAAVFGGDEADGGVEVLGGRRAVGMAVTVAGSTVEVGISIRISISGDGICATTTRGSAAGGFGAHFCRG